MVQKYLFYDKCEVTERSSSNLNETTYTFIELLYTHYNTKYFQNKKITFQTQKIKLSASF